MNRFVDGIEELGDLIDTEQHIGVENECDDNLTRSKRPTLEGCVECVGERIAARRVPDAGTVVPGRW